MWCQKFDHDFGLANGIKLAMAVILSNDVVLTKPDVLPDETELLKKQISNLKGQITKLKRKEK